MDKIYTLVRENQTAIFSKTQLEVLHLICEGYTNDEIAQKFNRSPKTTESCKRLMYEKASKIAGEPVNNAIKLFRFALSYGFIGVRLYVS